MNNKGQHSGGPKDTREIHTSAWLTQMLATKSKDQKALAHKAATKSFLTFQWFSPPEKELE